MKNKKIYKKIVLLIILLSAKVSCYQTITLFLKPFPVIKDEQASLKKVKKLSRPSKGPKYVLRSFTKPFIASGIFCSYYGNTVITNLNGEATFINKLRKPKLQVIITKNIIPVLCLENTVHHWELSRRRDVKIYNMERRFDAASKAYFWDVKEAPLPEDNVVPLNAITIFAEPRHVDVPIGITITTKNPQLVLPNMYVKPGINRVKSALLLFNVKNLVAPTKILYKKGKKYYAKHLKNE